MSLSPIQGPKVDHRTKQGANAAPTSEEKDHPSEASTVEEKAASVSQKCLDELNLAQERSSSKHKGYKIFASDNEDMESDSDDKDMFASDGEFDTKLLVPPKQTEGSINYINGDVYTGEVRNRKAWGKGKLTYKDGSIYIGEFKFDKPDGKGQLTFQDGCCYTGEFKDGLFHGEGIIEWKNGDRYKGAFENGVRQGKGQLTFQKGCYTGEFKDGHFHGEGIIEWKNGDRYEGAFENGVRHGKGIMTDRYGHLYEGTWKNSLLHGDCMITYKDESPKTVKFKNGCRIDFDGSEIGGSHFFRLLFSLPLDRRASFDEPLWILIDFLNQNGYQKYTPELMEVCQQLQISPEEFEQEAKKIHTRLINDHQSKLLSYSSRTHAMGLNLAPDPNDTNFVICEIFNSGGGLDIHPRKLVDGKPPKYQTMLQVRVPAGSLTPEKIQLFLKGSFDTVEEAYDAILKLEGAEILEQAPGEEIWQAAQKGDNCSLKWIFAYLKNKMPPSEYHQMRYELFATCAAAAQNNFSTEAEIKLFEDHAAFVFYKTIKKLRKLDMGIQKSS